MRRFRLEINDQGYLLLPRETASEFFPEDACLALWQTPELWIYPVRGANAGGLLIKQRNAHGDRSVLVHEALPLNFRRGEFEAFWDEDQQAMRMALVAK